MSMLFPHPADPLVRGALGIIRPLDEGWTEHGVLINITEEVVADPQWFDRCAKSLLAAIRDQVRAAPFKNGRLLIRWDAR